MNSRHKVRSRSSALLPRRVPMFRVNQSMMFFSGSSSLLSYVMTRQRKNRPVKTSPQTLPTTFTINPNQLNPDYLLNLMWDQTAKPNPPSTIMIHLSGTTPSISITNCKKESPPCLPSPDISLTPLDLLYYLSDWLTGQSTSFTVVPPHSRKQLSLWSINYIRVTLASIPCFAL